MEVNVEIKNATSSIDSESVTIQVQYHTGIGGLDECSTPTFLDGDDDGTFIFNSTSTKTAIKFKKYGLDNGGTSCNPSPSQPGSDWKDSATVKIIEAGTIIFNSDGHKYCLNYDSIEIQGDDNQIRNR